MIEFVGFEVAEDPGETAPFDGFESSSAIHETVPPREDVVAVANRAAWTRSRGVMFEPPKSASPTVTVGGVAAIPAGQLSVRVAVGPGYPAIAAVLTGPDAGADVAVVSLDGYGMATIDVNRAPWSEVQLTWFIVEQS
jgi:hypothetical protein